MIRLAPLLLVLAGCSTLVPEPPERALVAVAASCLPKELPTRPILVTDAELARLDAYHFVIALRVNADRLTVYADELEAVVSACR